MPPKKKSTPKTKNVETITHGEATRKNIPTVEYQPLMKDEDKSPLRIAYERRNRDMNPQLLWRGNAPIPAKLRHNPEKLDTFYGICIMGLSSLYIRPLAVASLLDILSGGDPLGLPFFSGVNL